MIINLKIINYIFFGFIFLVSIFDPQNMLGMRYPLLASLLPFYVYYFFDSLCDLEHKFIIFILSYLLPIWGTVIYLLRSDLSFHINDTSYFSFAIAFSTVHLLNSREKKEYFNRISIISGIAFSVIIIYNAVEFLFLNSSILTDFVLSKNIARVSFREYGNIRLPYIYYYSSTILILPLSVLIYTKKNIRVTLSFFIILFAFFLTGTRSHNILSLFFLFYFFKKSLKRNHFQLFILVSILILSSTYYQKISNALGALFDTQEVSNNYKLSMLEKYNLIFSDPFTLIMGQGFQAVDWCPELASIVSENATKTEWTFIELFRVFGIFLSSIMLTIFFLFIIKKHNPNDEFKKIALMGLLLDSAFNPHLFSTYGAILMASIFSYTHKLKSNEI